MRAGVGVRVEEVCADHEVPADNDVRAEGEVRADNEVHADPEVNDDCEVHGEDHELCKKDHSFANAGERVSATMRSGRQHVQGQNTIMTKSEQQQIQEFDAAQFQHDQVQEVSQ